MIDEKLMLLYSPGLLDLASPEAANAIFALTAVALDLSCVIRWPSLFTNWLTFHFRYIVPIFCRRLFRNHPEVNFKPGPFYMGDGAFGWFVNIVCITWTVIM